MKHLKTLLASLISAAAVFGNPAAAMANGDVESYRLFNPNTGEHFYTTSQNESDDLFSAGWWFEGVSWRTSQGGKPVFRVYNPNSGEHHYTLSAFERDALLGKGWSYEGVAFRSAPGNSVKVYRLFDPKARNAGSHLYTTEVAEANALQKQGWRYEGVGWNVDEKGELLAQPLKPVFPYNPTPSQPTNPGNSSTNNGTSSSVQKWSTAGLTQVSSIEDASYVISLKQHKYHLPSCGHLDKLYSVNTFYTTSTWQDIEAREYEPCKVCHPNSNQNNKPNTGSNPSTGTYTDLSLDGLNQVSTRGEANYVLNINPDSGKFHRKGCRSEKIMNQENKVFVYDTRENILAHGFISCENCNS